MPLFLKLALRNVFRNRRRTLITLAAMGFGLARAFGVKPGDDLTLLTSTKGGGINALAVKVRGLWESGEKAYDDRFLRVGIGEVQRLLDVEPDEVQSVVLLLDGTEHTAL